MSKLAAAVVELVVAIGAAAAVTAARAQWSRLEPRAIDHTLYVRGIGTVVERAVKGGDDHLEPLSLKRAR